MPHWTHDCDDCIYLGTTTFHISSSLGNIFDSYVCLIGRSHEDRPRRVLPQNNQDALITRRGNDGPDYLCRHPAETADENAATAVTQALYMQYLQRQGHEEEDK